MIQIPSPVNKLWAQPNNTDVYNPNISQVLYSTFNCNFYENMGRVRLGERMILNISLEGTVGTGAYPAGFRYFNNGSDSSFYTIAGDSGTGFVLKSSSISGSWGTVVPAGAPLTIDSLTSDIETSFGELYVSSAVAAKVYYLNGSNVWANLTAGAAGDVMMMTAFGHRMYCTKAGNIIQSWDSTHTVVTSLTLPVGTNITFLRAASNKIWIGTVSLTGERGYIYEWDGASLEATKSYRLESGGALSCVIKDDIPYVMDTNGSLIVFNGGTFKKLTSFYRKNNKQLFNPFYRTNQRFIHPNGMAIIKKKIHLLVDLTNYDVSSHNGTQEDCNPSGVWEYDEETNSLRHKYSFGLSLPAGTIKDYGQERIYGAGALAEIITAQSPITTNGTFLAGSSFYTDATTIVPAISYEDTNDTLKKAGNFTTLKIESPNITDTWQALYHKFKKLALSTDKIVCKYRTEDVDPVEATITWTSTTTFTVPNSSVVVSNYWTAATGGEVEVVQGIGSGLCSHITSAVLAAGTWTVTVDETYTGATGTAKARFNNWIKIGVMNDQTSNFTNYKFKLAATSTWVQIKTAMVWTGKKDIEQVVLQNNSSQSANN